MGWTFYPAAPASPKDTLNRTLTWTNDGGARHVLKGLFVGSTYYAAVEHQRPDGSVHVYAVVILTQRSKGEWGYKDMDESMDPNEARCPRSVLALLSPTDSGFAQRWRERCERQLLEDQGKARAGARICYGGTDYTLTRPAGLRKGWIVHRVPDGMQFRMNCRQLRIANPSCPA